MFQKLHGWLEPEGRIAITYQPLGKHTPGLDEFADRLIDELKQADFVQIRRETKLLRHRASGLHHR
ncbi:hypothetical protein [Polycladomyces subterraneus]|uniref:Uncharacterized protein n=1 Tax=Polycladomyces subterraneus TaxID=1016997 RepID=A0ABT8IM61_9BACL|nr:hypothetical protein [Polycladomyces subterraneus]MDN4593871.1 hypothetical protein [Polycladomyces subterraneus]